MSYRTFAVGLAAAAALLAAVPAGASAAVSATLSKACYSNIPTRGSEPIVATLTGGTPGGRFQLNTVAPNRPGGSLGFVSGNFDAAGNAVAQITSWRLPTFTINPSKGQTVVLTVSDYTAGALDVPVAQTRVTNVAMDVSSKPRSPRRKRKVAVSGSPFANQRLYGFIVKGTSRKVLRRISLGRANACGYVSSRQIVAPRSYRPGSYRLYVNAGRTLNKQRAIGSRFRITRRLL